MQPPEKSESTIKALPTAKVLLWNRALSGRECEIVQDFGPELEELVDYLTGTMYEHNGVGLAAPQIGVFKRVAVIQLVEDRKRPPFVMVNPAIINSAGSNVDREGCLSLPGTYTRERVRRPSVVKVVYQNIVGKSEEMEARGPMARAVQHEVDHLHGQFFIDHLSSLKRGIICQNYARSIAARNQVELLWSYMRINRDAAGKILNCLTPAEPALPPATPMKYIDSEVLS